MPAVYVKSAISKRDISGSVCVKSGIGKRLLCVFARYELSAETCDDSRQPYGPWYVT